MNKEFHKDELKRIQEALDNANRFISRAMELKKELSINEYCSTSKKRSAAKRASMDLSRSLTEFRKGGC